MFLTNNIHWVAETYSQCSLNATLCGVVFSLLNLQLAGILATISPYLFTLLRLQKSGDIEEMITAKLSTSQDRVTSHISVSLVDVFLFYYSDLLMLVLLHQDFHVRSSAVKEQ